MIHLKYNKQNKNLEFYFYLTLLIRENPNILNYEYNEEYIKELNKENYNNKLNQIIKAKFIIELTQEYKLDFDYFDNEKGKELDEIINTNVNIIKKNIDFFSDLNLSLNINEIILFPIDRLYNEIIYGLIKAKKFSDYNYINGIIKQLNLDNIDITEYMYNNMEIFLNNEKKELIIKEYSIKEEKDFKDNLKINFCLFLIKYFYKNDYYINNSKFISQLKESLKKILKINKDKERDKNPLINIEDDKYKKIRYILDILCLKPKKSIKNNLKTYYNNFIKQKEELEKQEKNKDKNNKDKNEQYQKEPETMHEELYIIEFINQILNVEEFRSVYNEIMNGDEKAKKNFEPLLELLIINDEDDKYKEKLSKILLEKFQEFKGNKELNENILKKIFKFNTLEDDEILKPIENRIESEESNSISIKESILDKFNTCFEELNKNK